MADKASIREDIKLKINNLGEDKRRENSLIIANNLLRLPEFNKAESIFVYISFDNEVNTRDIIIKALTLNKKVYVPVMKGLNMAMCQINNDTVFCTNKYGISEPENRDNICSYNVELAVIPLVAYDRNLDRLGRGKGYYDKILSKSCCVKAALAYSVQEVDKLPIEPHDVKMDIIVNEKEVLR